MWRFASAIRNCEPIIIEDIEDIREEAPKEYEMYKRLKVKSVLGVPYRNCSSGLMVVRNPKQFKDNFIVLNIMPQCNTRMVVYMHLTATVADDIVFTSIKFTMKTESSTPDAVISVVVV